MNPPPEVLEAYRRMLEEHAAQWSEVKDKACKHLNQLVFGLASYSLCQDCKAHIPYP